MSTTRLTKPRLRAIVLGIRDTLSSRSELPEPQEPPAASDDVHARGHQHLAVPPGEHEPAAGERPRQRPWTRNLRRWGQVHHKSAG